jgi:hypothetical protein
VSRMQVADLELVTVKFHLDTAQELPKEITQAIRGSRTFCWYMDCWFEIVRRGRRRRKVEVYVRHNSLALEQPPVFDGSLHLRLVDVSASIPRDLRAKPGGYGPADGAFCWVDPDNVGGEGRGIFARGSNLTSVRALVMDVLEGKMKPTVVY